MNEAITTFIPPSKEPVPVRTVDLAWLAELPPSLAATMGAIKRKSLTISEQDQLSKGISKKEAEAALAHAGAMLAEAHPDAIKKQIAKLYAVMPMQGRSEADLRVLAETYVEDLRTYPIDVIVEACRFWRRTEKWFPRIVELRQRCDVIGRDRIAWRSALLDALRNPD